MPCHSFHCPYLLSYLTLQDQNEKSTPGNISAVRGNKKKICCWLISSSATLKSVLPWCLSWERSGPADVRSLKWCILLQGENIMTLRVTDVAYLYKCTQGNVSVTVCGWGVVAPLWLSGQGAPSVPTIRDKKGRRTQTWQKKMRKEWWESSLAPHTNW